MSALPASRATVLSPMPTGSGSITVHRALEQSLPGYQVRPYNPWWTLFPPSLPLFARHPGKLIHSGADYGAFFGRPGRPLVVTFHNYVLDAFMRPFSSRLQWLHYRSDLRTFTKWSLRHADAITAVSEATAALVREDLGFKGEIRVIPNGIDAGFFTPAARAPRREFVALFSGNFSRRKGAQWIPDIAARLEDGQRIECIGAGVPAANGERLLYRNRVPYRQMPECYASCDAMLFPTVREGMSLAVLEAMACGLPVVATDCASMREVIEDGKGGFLCPLGDTAAFAERLRWLAARPEQRIAMGAFNRGRILAHHRVQTMTERYRDVFDGLVPGLFGR